MLAFLHLRSYRVLAVLIAASSLVGVKASDWERPLPEPRVPAADQDSGFVLGETFDDAEPQPGDAPQPWPADDVSRDELQSLFQPSAKANNHDAPRSKTAEGDLEKSSRERVPPVDVRLPGEFEQHEALLLACTDLATVYPDVYADIVFNLTGKLRIFTLVRDAQQRERVGNVLAEHMLPRDAVSYLVAAHDTMWVRDYGPIFVTTGHHARLIVDADYVQFGRPDDDDVPAALAVPLHTALIHAPLDLEGGNLLSNGRGLLVTTTELLDQNAPQELGPAAVTQILRQYFGATEVVFLERLKGESTGHVDMFVTFVADDTVLVGAYDPAVDAENADILERNAQRLTGLRTADGRPLKVVRIPMPSNADGSWRTYTNVIFANGTLLVPVYPGHDQPAETEALQTYRDALPGWEIVGIDSRELIQLGGALHCASMLVPPADEPPGAARPVSVVASVRPPAAPASRFFPRRVRRANAF